MEWSIPLLCPHSACRSEMKISCVPVLDDNFAYLLIDEAGVTAAIDPAEADKVAVLVISKLLEVISFLYFASNTNTPMAEF